jgi:hypothetical protein
MFDVSLKQIVCLSKGCWTLYDCRDFKFEERVHSRKSARKWCENDSVVSKQAITLLDIRSQENGSCRSVRHGLWKIKKKIILSESNFIFYQTDDDDHVHILVYFLSLQLASNCLLHIVNIILTPEVATLSMSRYSTQQKSLTFWS